MAHNTPKSDLFFAIRDGAVEKLREILAQNEDPAKMLNHPYNQASPVGMFIFYKY